MSRARAVRQRAAVDSAFRSYSADARGFVYFLLDQEGTSDRTLIKADQIALKIYWKAPSHTRQHILGRRDEKRLPTRVKYHLDHLTVIQDDFADRITVGDGDEVRAVVHPVAPRSEELYDFRLADSLTITLLGASEAIRVYEIEVRPRDFQKAGFLGSVFVDRATDAIVRMRFTFTAASYVDPQLDYIRISLENSLWEGKYWLPHRQQIEIRRETPIFDLPAGTVIQGRFEIGGYSFNPDVRDEFFRGRRVTAAPPSEQEAFPFEEELHAEIETEGFAIPPDLDEIRKKVVEEAVTAHLSGLGRIRLFLPSASSVLRYNRAEGLFFGGGLSFQATPTLLLRGLAGYAAGSGDPVMSLSATPGGRLSGMELRMAWNDVRDIGPWRGISGAMNSIAAILLDDDYLDPYLVSGASVAYAREVGGVRVHLAGRWERHGGVRSIAEEDGGGETRPLLSVSRGDAAALAAGASTGDGTGGLHLDATVTLGRFEETAYARLLGTLGWTHRRSSPDVALTGSVRVGGATTKAPRQELFLLGGRGTLPGFDYRSFSGDRVWLASLHGSWALRRPWLVLKGYGSSGGSDHRGAPPLDWGTAPTGGTLFSAGLGVALFWDILHVDAGRGLNGGGGWEYGLSITRTFWKWL